MRQAHNSPYNFELTLCHFRAVDTGNCRGRVDAMEQGLPGEVGVDEGGHDTNLGAAQPDADILGSVLHEERYAVSGLVAQPEEEVRDAIAVVLEIEESPAPILEDECGAVWAPIHSPPEHARHGEVHLPVEHDEQEQFYVAIRAPAKKGTNPDEHESMRSLKKLCNIPHVSGTSMPDEVERVVSSSDDINSEGDAADEPDPEAFHGDPGGRQCRGRGRDEKAADRDELQHC